MQRVLARTFRGAGAAREVAAGMALGLFIAVLPLMGLQLPIALGAAMLLRRLGLGISSVSAATGVWLTNPLTAVPIYSATYLLGLPFARLIISDRPDGAAAVTELGAKASMGTPIAWQAVLALVIGGFVLGAPVAAIGYRLTLRAVERYRARLHDRKRRRNQRGAIALEQGRALAPVAVMTTDSRG